MAVSRSLRFQVFRRDNHTCQYCGGQPPDVALVVDHVVPAALGGSDKPENLTTACKDCNAGKSATPPDAPVIQAVSERQRLYRAEMERLAQEELVARSGRDLDWFLRAWEKWFTGCTCGPGGGKAADCEGDAIPLPQNWAGSVRTWISRGLTEADIEWAIDRTMNKADLLASGAFRYMAGTCWRTLTQREEAAAAALGDDT